MKYSIVMPVLNNLRYTIEAVQSVQQCSEDYELLLVDGGSTDGTVDWINTLSSANKGKIRPLSSPTPGFPSQINHGLRQTRGEYIVWLNNDVIVTPRWLEKLSWAIEHGAEKTGAGRVGLSGPVSNSVGGRQVHPNPNYDIPGLVEFALAHEKENAHEVYLSGFLSGFCLMITRQVLADVGLLDERYNPGGFEDNDYILRAEALGWRGVIAADTFIHHYGSRTISLPKFRHMQGGLANGAKFYEAWHSDRPKKLLAIYRVRDCAALLKKSLQRTAEFADSIVVLCDRCTDDTPAVARAGPKVVDVFDKKGEFNELKDRAKLLEMAKKHDPDWIISIDADEIFEEKFTRAYAQRLMHPVNPHIKAYGFRWCTFWDSDDHWRSDGIFGDIHGLRMFRNEPHQALTSTDPRGFHMSMTPAYPPENFRWTNIRVKHYGYEVPAIRLRKHEFYTSTDTEKIAFGIGSPNYDHLISTEVSLKTWRASNDLALVLIVQDEAQALAEHLDLIGSTCDEIIIVHTGQAHAIRAIAERYNAHYCQHSFRNDFSKIRQYAKDLVQSEWILTLDPDERIEDRFIENLPRLIETDAAGYLTTIENFQADGTSTTTDAIRLFRNLPEFVYRSCVHENFDQAVQDHDLKIFQCPFPIAHFGYAQDTKKHAEKMKFYKKLVKKQLRKDPDDKMAIFNLALHHQEDGEPLRAMALFTQAARLDPAYFHPRVQLGALHLKAAHRWLTEASAILPPHHRLTPQIKSALEKIQSAL
ncbi:MAG: glycosyltransferase [Phycisphaerae bacterium]|nr:glycosyltransferase [Phycisphaerae bacterium]